MGKVENVDNVKKEESGKIIRRVREKFEKLIKKIENILVELKRNRRNWICIKGKSWRVVIVKKIEKRKMKNVRKEKKGEMDKKGIKMRKMS